VLRPMAWMRIVRLASADSVFSSLIADSNKLGYCLQTNLNAIVIIAVDFYNCKSNE
jgi:hypothetical protein